MCRDDKMWRNRRPTPVGEKKNLCVALNPGQGGGGYVMCKAIRDGVPGTHSFARLMRFSLDS